MITIKSLVVLKHTICENY